MAQSPTPPTIHLVFDALTRNLLPDPLLPCLASTLNLYAHLILFSRQLSDDAEQILNIHNQLLIENESRGVQDGEALVGERGCLTEVEGLRVSEVKRRSVEKMFRLSVEIRKHHIARLLSTKGALLSRAHTLIDHYFPDYSLEKKSYKQHAHLHISSMTKPEAKVVAEGREQVLSWVEDAEAVLAADDYERPLRYDIFIPDQFKASVHAKALAESMCAEAERIIRDAEDIQAILANDGSWDSQAYEAELKNRGKKKGDVEKKKEKARRRHTLPARSVNRSPAPESTRNPTPSPPRDILPPAIPLTPPPARHRARESLPLPELHRVHDRGPSPDPTPAHVKSLPRRSFSTGKKTSLRGSSISRVVTQVEAQETPSHAALPRRESGPPRPPINWKVNRERFSHMSSDSEDSSGEKEVAASINPTTSRTTEKASVLQTIESPRFVPSSPPRRVSSSPVPPPTKPAARTIAVKAAAGSSRLSHSNAVAGPSRIPASSLPATANGRAYEPRVSDGHKTAKERDLATPSGTASKAEGSQRANDAEASSKKRVRQSYGFAGPDFTAPVGQERPKKKAKPRATG
ncbi:hypothetical protein I350_02814 [Cryptococcus amylolentus CBS 6273]|uniref:Uncharacterized protein n=1 Tax=Cryptococcus amylolentus CBS 6273 TaxID=1296118 RepID=A0A1E3K7Q4_9TREE|nr:hypothetical protein I350_02814 [Cryptococcus amylolentus CBS 6273]